MEKSCALCQTPVYNSSVAQGENLFCCAGCQAVHGILAAKNALESACDHPLFKQAASFGLISNPTLLEELKKKEESASLPEKQRLCLELSGLFCPSCAEVIRLVLLGVKGVYKCTVDYATDLCVVQYSPKEVPRQKIIQTIESLDYEATPLESLEKRAVSRTLFWRLFITAFFSINVMMLSYTLYASELVGENHTHEALLSHLMGLLATPVLVVGGVPIAKRAYRTLKVGILGMECLVTLGVTAAWALSFYNLFQGTAHVYFDSIAVVITLVYVGQLLESKAKFSAKDTLMEVVRSLPKRARKKGPDGIVSHIPLKDVKIGDILLVNSSEKIPLDGEVLFGEGVCNEAMMTGESLPIVKKRGEKLISGSYLMQGTLEYRVTSVYDRSTLYQLIETVSFDLERGVGRQSPLDTLLQWFVPVTLLIAVIAAIFKGGVAGLSVLLISCPCAIGIAAPLAESRVIFALLKKGVLVRNRKILPLLGRESVFLFDKTGTVTDGKFKVLAGLEEIPQKEKALLKGLAAKSSHPLSRFLSHEIKGKGAPIEEFREHPGLGIQGKSGGDIVKLGSKEFVACGKPGLNFSINGTSYPIELGDTPRGQVRELLHSLGVEAKLLSGDNESAVSKIAEQCGFQSYQSKMKPLEKREVVLTLQKEGKTVAMIGDGFNDGPALALADIGITLGSATDFSIHISDLLLLEDDLHLLLKARQMGRLGQKILRQNLFWAFFYNGVGIIIAAIGLLTPLYSAIAMALSSFFTIINTKRL